MEKVSIGAINCAYPLASFLVGTYDAEGKPNVMFAAWGGICCSTPACMNVSVRPQRHTHAAIEARKAFTISIPGIDIAAQADYTGLVSGAKADKFAETGLTPVRSNLVDAPYVAECPVVIELSLKDSISLGSHTMFIGVVEDVKANSDILGDNRIPDFVKMQAMIYAPGNIYQVPAKDGSVKAYSAGKKYLK